MESWVSTPPMIMPTAPPTGAPAEKVAKATERAREGGKACARMPSWGRGGVGRQAMERGDGTGRTEAGTTAAPPMPWKARRTSIVISSLEGR